MLESIFNTYWGGFEADLKKILETIQQTETPKPRSEKSMLVEILENTRFVAKRISSIEERIDNTNEKHQAEKQETSSQPNLEDVYNEIYKDEIIENIFNPKIFNEINKKLKDRRAKG